MNNLSVKKLNKEQTTAVKYKSGPLLIIAGAGTGKTTVLTERIKYLIQKDLAKPKEILALTFTEKSAREMEERVDLAMPYGYTQMWISTFHSFCDRVLRDNLLHIGLDPKYKLMTEAENVQFLRAHLFDLDLKYFRPLGNPLKFVSGLVQHFSRLQDEDVSSGEYLDWVGLKLKHKKPTDQDEVNKWQELAETYRKYEELKVKYSVMDYGDLIAKTLLLFRQRKNILKEYQTQFNHVLVDEFQDTNVAQYELLKLICPPGNNSNLTVVGDDSQSIYKFRGAAISNILYFKKDYRKAKTVLLTKNYRSSQTILDSSYKLIQHNNPDTLESQLGIDKNLISVKNPSGGNLVQLIHKDRVENEADFVAKEVRRLVESDNSKVKFGDIAILVRANSHAEPFIRALQRNAVPYQFLGPGRLFKQPEVVDLISYLKVLYDFNDSVSFYRLLAIDYFGIDVKDLIRIGNYARKYNLSLYEASEKVEDIFVSEETKEKIKKITEVINKHLELTKKETAGQLLFYFLEDMDLLPKILNPDNVEAQKRALNISKFFDKLKTYEVDHEDASVSAVADWIDLSSELGESPLAADFDWTKVNAVSILTVHSAKGLEFPVVFLVNLVSQRFPTNERREQIPIPEELIKEVLPQGDFHLQEERRLFYVGMTRAMDYLYFTAADYYGEGKREKKLSPFIFEALGDQAVSAEMSKTDDGQQLSFLDYSSSRIRVTTETKVSDKQESKTSDLHIDYLSFSQIETFQICPLHYKLRYIYRIPTPVSASQSFGTSIHETIKEFYTRVNQGSNPTDELIFDILTEEWVKEGFVSKSHEKKFFDKAKLYLAGFLKEGFTPKVTPYLMEQRFTLPLKYKAKEKPLKIGGVMDRVDVFPDGSIEIIDYKTGATIPTQREVDNNLQLTFYALAATSIREEPFEKSADKVSLSLYFLDGQQKMTTLRRKEQLEKAIDTIYEVRRQIETSDFKCSGHIFCQNKCEYSLFCQSEQGSSG